MRFATNMGGSPFVLSFALYGALMLAYYPVKGGLIVPNLPPIIPPTLVQQCCFVQSRTHSYNFEKLVTYRTKSTPGRGPVVQLYKNPIYHQAINKNICYSKQDTDNNPNCRQGFCEQQYINQEAMIHDASFGSENDIGLGEIWVESGCRFTPFEGLEVNTIYENEEDESDVEKQVPRRANPAWFVRFVRR